MLSNPGSIPKILISFIKQCLLKKRNGAIWSGLLLGLSVPGIGLWPLAWVGLVPGLFALSACRKWPEALLQGFLLGFIYHAILSLWFWGLHPLTWLGCSTFASLGLTAAGWLFIGIQGGLIFGLWWLILYWLWPRCPASILVVTAPFLWLLLYWFLNQHPMGLPWGFLAYSQAGVPWIRMLAYPLNLWGVEYLIVFVNFVLFDALGSRQRELLLSPFLLAAFAVWQMLSHPIPHSTVLRELKPVIIQGNLSIEAERLFMNASRKKEYYQALINHTLTHSTPKLLVLPEGVLATPQIPPLKIPAGIALLSGSVFPGGTGYYNGTALFYQDKTQTVGKRILVPFGETTPFVSGKWLGQAVSGWGIQYGGDYEKAPWNQPLFHLGNTAIGPFVCFEALYPTLAQDYKTKQARLLVTVSNLGWYHDHPLLSAQFLAINQFRAAETGTPLLLSTNTGISAIISESGEILGQTQPGKTQSLQMN